MARTVRDTNLETRTARARLKLRGEPYWRAVDRGAHLGYYRGARGGSWIARLYREGRYQKHDLGRADDSTDGDGLHVLDYFQALDRARAWFAEQARTAAGLEPKPAGPYTVKDAMADYLADYERQGKRGARTVKSAINAHINPTLGSIEVAKLTTARLRAWLHGIAEGPGLLRSKAGKPRKHRAAPKDADGRRRRKAAANRIFNVLQAAFNFAWRQGKAPSDDAWRKVERFRDVDAPVIRYLTDAECGRLVNASADDFRELVKAALLTGCRYGELTALRCHDFNPDAGTLLVRTSKSGKSRHVVLTEEAQRFFADATAGRAADAVVFLRTNGTPWHPSDKRRPLLAACKAARIVPVIGFHVLRHTHGSTLAMRGVPLPVIAKQLGHADTRMTEKHYAHLSPSYVAETIRASFPTLGIVEKGKVAAIGAAKR